jgi:3-deoxy-D-manno-octulosonate cytidylyltransferase
MTRRRTVCVVPARLASTRFPSKVLKSLQGKPILQWIFEAAQRCDLFDETVFAVDHPKTEQLVHSFGGQVVMTSPDCPNGTRRIIDLIERTGMEGDIWVNWQADEPFLGPDIMGDLLSMGDNDGSDVWTLKKKIIDCEELDEPSIVKVVTGSKGNALYFSRQAIPHGADVYYKHVGLYAYSRDALEKIASHPVTELEEAERLEQLGFLYHGLKLRVFETVHETFGIDLPEDLEKAHNLILTGM